METTKKSYQRFRYTEEDLFEAIEAIRNNVLSINKSAKQYNIPKGTLINKLHNKVPLERKMGPATTLTTIEEKRLEKWIIGKAKLGFPMHPDEVKDAVQKVMKETRRPNPFVDDRPGRKWLQLFLKRNIEIAKKNTEIISKARAAVTEDAIKGWFRELDEFLDSEAVNDLMADPSRIFNADETGLNICPKTGKLLGPKVYRNFYEIAAGGEKECITVLCNFSANGKAVDPMIVLPYKRIPRDIAESVPDGYSIGRSDSGWMVSATFYEYVANVFYPWLLCNKIKFPVILFLDGHKSHINEELYQFCVEKHIFLFCLLPNATHILQPCDVAIFRPLKSEWKKEIRQHKQRSSRSISKANFAPLFHAAYTRALKSDTVKRGFEVCGLFPLDPNRVDYSKCISTRRKELQESQGLELDPPSEKNDAKIVLKVLEKEMPPELLLAFQECKKTGETHHIEKTLFKIWEKYTNKTDSQTDLNEMAPILSNVDALNNLTNQQISPYKPASNLHESFVNAIEPQISQTEFNVVYSKENLGEVQDSTQIKTPQDVWKSHLHWPMKEDGKGIKKRKSEKVPFAVTSKKWKEYHEKKTQEKLDKEEQKKKRQEERATKKITEPSKKKGLKRKEFSESETETDSDRISLADTSEEESIDFFWNRKKCDAKNSEKPDQCQNETLQNYEINDYVIIEYEKEYFPGIVVCKSEEESEVKVMTMCGPNTWKWPDKPDQIWYKKHDIKERISAPEVFAMKGLYGVLYTVPEMAKYRKPSLINLN